jgi:hypothetical protein
MVVKLFCSAFLLESLDGTQRRLARQLVSTAEIAGGALEAGSLVSA